MTAALFYSVYVSHTAVTPECLCLITSLQLMKVMSSWSLREKSFFIFSYFSKFQVSFSSLMARHELQLGPPPPPPQEVCI